MLSLAVELEPAVVVAGAVLLLLLLVVTAFTFDVVAEVVVAALPAMLPDA